MRPGFFQREVKKESLNLISSKILLSISKVFLKILFQKFRKELIKNFRTRSPPRRLKCGLLLDVTEEDMNLPIIR